MILPFSTEGVITLASMVILCFAAALNGYIVSAEKRGDPARNLESRRMKLARAINEERHTDSLALICPISLVPLV